MLFHNLKLSGLLSFGPDGINLPMKPLNVLIGSNGSGKSNLLEAISLLQAASRGISEPISRTGGIREWTWKGAEASDSITLDVLVSFLPGPTSRAPSAIFRSPDARSVDVPPRGMLRHRLTLGGQDGRTVVADEHVEPLETSPETHDDVAYHRPPRDKQVAAVLDAAVQRISTSGNPHGDAWPAFVHGRQGAVEFASGYKADESLLSFFASPNFPALWHLKEQYGRIRLYRNWSFGPDAGSRLPCSAHARSDFLEEGAGNLPLVLSQLHGTQRKTLLTALDKLFDGIVDVQCPVTGGTVALFLEEAGDRSIPASRLSDGTLRYLSLLAVLLHPEPPPLICIEEPELGLHPDLLPTLADLMIEASERSQLVVTTHSDVLVDALRSAGERRGVREARWAEWDATARQGGPRQVAEGLSTWGPLDIGRTGREPVVTATLYVEGGRRSIASCTVSRRLETWFLADRDALRRYFGAEFRENAIRQWPELEVVPKATVLGALERATAACRKGYAKGKVSFELLARIDPARVEAACPHARALLDRLRAE